MFSALLLLCDLHFSDPCLAVVWVLTLGVGATRGAPAASTPFIAHDDPSLQLPGFIARNDSSSDEGLQFQMDPVDPVDPVDVEADLSEDMLEPGEWLGGMPALMRGPAYTSSLSLQCSLWMVPHPVQLLPGTVPRGVCGTQQGPKPLLFAWGLSPRSPTLPWPRLPLLSLPRLPPLLLLPRPALMT